MMSSRCLTLVLAAFLAVPASAQVRVRGTFDGATLRVLGAGGAVDTARVLSPRPDTHVLVMQGVELASETLAPRLTWVDRVQVLGPEAVGAGESRLVIHALTSGLAAVITRDGDDLVLSLEPSARRAPRAADAEAEARPPEAAAASGEQRAGRPESRPRPPRVSDEKPSVARRDREQAQPAEARRGREKAPAAGRPTSTRPEALPSGAPIQRTSDGMILIAEGPFVMGTAHGRGFADESPEQVVWLDEFAIDEHEVTIEEFERSPLTLPRQPEWNWSPDQPVLSVTWGEADEYCEWAGKRLPTEAEWEKAARGSDGRLHPWGNTWGVHRASSGVDGDGHEHSAPVGSFPEGASPHGVQDMAGNAWEWVAGWYEAERSMGPRNPTGPDHGSRRVARGGSFRGSSSFNLRAAVRRPEKGSSRHDDVGFRCAR